MASSDNSNSQPSQTESLADDFFEQILAVPAYTTTDTSPFNGVSDGNLAMTLQLGSGSDGLGQETGFRGMGIGMGMGMGVNLGMPLGLNLEHGFLKHDESEFDAHNDANANASSSSTASERDSMHLTSSFPGFGHLQTPSICPSAPAPCPSLLPQVMKNLSLKSQSFYSQTTQGTIAAAPQPTAVRPRVRARRGQATDPHSIAERVRREKIAERMKALQELVPSCSKTDRAAMLDEIVDYVKFLRLQVKVLSMSRLGGAGAVAQLVADEGGGMEGGATQQAWEKWSNDGTEQQVARLLEEDIGAAMQFLQSKALCIMPISLASVIFPNHPPDASPNIKPKSNSLL